MIRRPRRSTLFPSATLFRSLTVNTGGVTAFDGAVGSTTALTSVTTDAPGTTDINGLVVNTTGAHRKNTRLNPSPQTTPYSICSWNKKTSKTGDPGCNPPCHT